MPVTSLKLLADLKACIVALAELRESFLAKAQAAPARWPSTLRVHKGCKAA